MKGGGEGRGKGCYVSDFYEVSEGMGDGGMGELTDEHESVGNVVVAHVDDRGANP